MDKLKKPISEDVRDAIIGFSLSVFVIGLLCIAYQFGFDSWPFWFSLGVMTLQSVRSGIVLFSVLHEERKARK